MKYHSQGLYVFEDHGDAIDKMVLFAKCDNKEAASKIANALNFYEAHSAVCPVLRPK